MNHSRRDDELLLTVLSRLKAGKTVSIKMKKQIVAVVRDDLESGDDPMEVLSHYPNITGFV